MKLKQFVATGVGIAAISAAGLVTVVTAHGGRSFENDSMVGLPAAFVGAANPVRGLSGGGIAWTIGEADVEVEASGKVEVSFSDLWFASGPNVGKNTVPTMKVVVSCLTEAGATMNVSTAAFPVTVATATDPGGDGSIEARLDLPKPCIAPIVFVATTTDRWLAVNGL